MTFAAKHAHKVIRAALDEAVVALTPADYRDVLEELSCDIEGRLDALNEEEGDE